MAGLSDAGIVQYLAVPSVCCLIAFLGYFTQFVFRYSTLEPGPLSHRETVIFNALLSALWVTYFRTVTVDAGRYEFPDTVIEAEGNWCKKCSAPKPPRAHHCRHCRRCIPKMDHHCPWTANCVSMTTFPHFIRFLVFANISLWYLASLVWQRFYSLWVSRHLPAYLGPTLGALIALALISLVCSMTCLALGIMLVTTTKGWLFNCTMIEGWQLERHEALMDRGGKDWWDITGPDGQKSTIERTEFPYDIGILANMAQAMGTSNFLVWLSPFAGNPKIGNSGKGTGWEWQENGFNRREGMWPPPDPEKLRRSTREWSAKRRDFASELQSAESSLPNDVCAFKERQIQDARRRNMLVAELEEFEGYDAMDQPDDYSTGSHASMNGTRWMNEDGERLKDYGVDEEADETSTGIYEEDDMPLGELLRRRRGVRPVEQAD